MKNPQFLRYEQAYYQCVRWYVSDKKRIWLRTDFELAQQLCSIQSGVGQQADHPEQYEETVVELNKCRLEQLSLSPMSAELARK